MQIKLSNMGLLGDFAKGFAIGAGILCVYAITSFALMRYVGLALLFLFTLMIPTSLIAIEYWNYRKGKETSSRQQDQS